MSPTTELTYEERIKMRRMLDALDAKEADGLKEFDLNKPPVPPYVYREYPFLMYHHQTKQTKPAINHEHRLKLLSEGWSENPVPVEVPQMELTPEERIQAKEIDRQLKMPSERFEIERSAQHLGELRAKIEQLEDQLAAREEPKKSTKRSKA